ncbi:MAG: TIGR02253 family HAD-type hydrolase [Nanoarchaeota archaeon]|nr:TIGR02253 family HAD-type hydrolase [Nanoarchaeota archaeon]MBU1704856.1 TIGR02253 family HAD-type hydrolase [Nanoarchaeota archaeon]
MIKAIIFDLDNTLIDFGEMKVHTCEAAIAGMIDAGLKIDRKKGMEILYELFTKYGMEDHNIFQRFLKKVKGKIDYRILANGIVAYRRVRSGFLEPYPHTNYVLLKLKGQGIKLAIVSDAPRLKAWIRLASMRLSDFFDVVITYDDTKRLKPSNLPFKKAVKMLNLKPADCLMVGDRPERDMKGAQKIGMQTCFAKYGNPKGKDISADYVIKDIKELLDIVST